MGSGNTSEQVGRSAKYSDEVYLEAISYLAEEESGLVTLASNIHARLIEMDKEISKRAVYNRLNDLRERQLIEREKISPEIHRWTITGEGEEVLEEARREDEEEDEEGGEDRE
jgi:DNA-binding HxlR family transcriptional regulator